jgi:hypothetical protein
MKLTIKAHDWYCGYCNERVAATVTLAQHRQGACIALGITDAFDA